MQQFIETIRVYRGAPELLPYHKKRVRETQYQHNISPLDNFIETIESYIRREKINIDTLYKCRVIYNKEIESITVEEYSPKEIKSLQMVNSDKINYQYKSTNRDELALLLNKRRQSDDIIIAKRGEITDTSFSNLILLDGEEWVTPRTPLLNGVMRQYLLDRGVVKSRDIRVDSIEHYSHVMLINAMLPFDISRAISINSVIL